MANKIGTSPRALLGVFGMKVGGENPPFFAETVVPTVDVYDQYLSDLAGIAPETVNPAAGVVTAEVFEGPIVAGITWRVFSLGVVTMLVVGADVGQDSNMSLWLVALDGNQVPIASLEYFVTQTERTIGVLFPRPLWLPPGWRVRASAVLSGAPANAWALSIRVGFNRVVE